MNNQINSSNNGDNVGNGVRLFGKCIQPNLPSPLRRVVQNPNNTIRLFGQIIENIPIHNAVDNPSIIASSQPLPSSYPNAVHNSTSVIGTNIIDHQMGNLFVNPTLESEYNGIPADQTNPAQGLPQERYEVLVKGRNFVEDLGIPLFDKDLDTALDSFDNLFCRRCLVFNCRLHGCSQELVFPAEKLVSKCGLDEENAPCGQHCYKVVVDSKSNKIPLIVEGATNKVINGKSVCSDGILGTEECVDEKSIDSKPWKTIEKSLYQKGLEIFGRNSCLIARNLMNGMKTCSEVFRYMNFSDNRSPYQAGDGKNYMPEGTSNADNN